MPRRSTKKKLVRYRRPRNKGKVSSIPRQIQCANYLPKQRLIKFQDFRSFVLTDNATPDIGGGTHVAHVPNLQISANDPGNAFVLGADSRVGSTGQWWSQSASADGTISKGTAVPNLAQWVCNQDGSGDGHYRTAQCLSSKMTVTAVPLSSSIDDDVQDVSKLCVQIGVNADGFMAKRINEDFNSEKISQLPHIKTANIYSNYGGTPKGATISRTYSFKKFNATQGRSSMNVFSLDATSPERDYFQLVFLPTDNEDYGKDASDSSVGKMRMPKMRVSVKVSYICLLSEPNNSVIGNDDNTGAALPHVPMTTLASLIPRP